MVGRGGHIIEQFWIALSQWIDVWHISSSQIWTQIATWSTEHKRKTTVACCDVPGGAYIIEDVHMQAWIVRKCMEDFEIPHVCLVWSTWLRYHHAYVASMTEVVWLWELSLCSISTGFIIVSSLHILSHVWWLPACCSTITSGAVQDVFLFKKKSSGSARSGSWFSLRPLREAPGHLCIGNMASSQGPFLKCLSLQWLSSCNFRTNDSND